MIGTPSSSIFHNGYRQLQYEAVSEDPKSPSFLLEHRCSSLLVLLLVLFVVCVVVTWLLVGKIFTEGRSGNTHLIHLSYSSYPT